MKRLKDWLEWHSIRSHIMAPIWLRIPEKSRWTVVHWLDKSRHQCWADLVSDALACREKDACDVHVPRLRGERAPRCASVCDWGHQADFVIEHAWPGEVMHCLGDVWAICGCEERIAVTVEDGKTITSGDVRA